MNGGTDSDDESAGMAYFLPLGIADDSPPKRSSAPPPGSFGPIGGRTPTASAGPGGGFHRANSPSTYLHLSAPASAAAAIPAASVATDGSNTAGHSVSHASLRSDGSFRLSDLGGEIHQPQSAGFGGAAASAIGGAFGYGIGSFRSGATRHESESAAHADSGGGGIFGRTAGTPLAASNTMAAGFGGASAGDTMFGRGSVSAGTGLYNRAQGDPLGMPPSFLSGAPASSPFDSTPHNWPATSSSSALTSSDVTAATTSANSRRVFQAPPGLGGPPMNSPRLGLGVGGDSLTGHASDSSGLQQSRIGGVFGAFSASPSSAAVSDSSFRASSHQFNPSLASPLSTLNLSSDVFVGNVSGVGAVPVSGERRTGITNPELAELNSHSVKMQDAVEETYRRAAKDPQSPDVKEIQSLKVDVQARSKKTKASAPAPLDHGYQRTGAVQTVKRVEKKKKQGLLSDGSPQSPPSKFRDIVASPASVGRVAALQSKTPTAVQLQGIGSLITDATPPRSSSATLSQKKQGSTETASSHRTAQNGSGRNVSATVDTGYESSDSADLGTMPSAGERASKKAAAAATDSLKASVNDKNSSSSSSARVSKKNTPRQAAQEKTPTSSTRRQVYREKQPKELAIPGAERQRLASADVHEHQLNSDEPECSKANGQTATSESRDNKTRTRKARVSQIARERDATQSAEDKATQSSSSFEPSDSSDHEASKRKKSLKLPNKSGAGVDVEPKLEQEQQQPNSQSSGSTDSAKDVAIASEFAESPRSGTLRSEKSSLTDEEETVDTDSKGAETQAFEPSDVKESEIARRDAVPLADATLPQNLSRPSAVEEKTPERAKVKETSLPNEEISLTEPLPVALSGDKKQQAATTTPPTSAKEQPQPSRKEKSHTKREKSEKKKGRHQKKEKRDSFPRSKGESFDVSDISDLDTGVPETSASTAWLGKVKDYVTSVVTAIMSFVVHFIGHVRSAYAYAFVRLNVKGVIGTGLYHLESVAAVVFSVVLLLSLHSASWFIRIHRVAFRAILTHRHIGFCFAFLYAFPFLVQYVFPWAPPWAPVCLWYAFLVQLFCTNGSTAMVTTFRIILPLVFLVEGISHHSFLLDLNGAELLLVSFIISAMKTSNLCSPIFFLSLAAQCLSAVFLGSELVVQWFQMALALYSLHSMVASEDDWNGFGDDEEDLSCHSMSIHHSIADYSHHPAPSAASIQKTKRLDRRALAYVRGRKFR